MIPSCAIFLTRWRNSKTMSLFSHSASSTTTIFEYRSCRSHIWTPTNATTQKRLIQHGMLLVVCLVRSDCISFCFSTKLGIEKKWVDFLIWLCGILFSKVLGQGDKRQNNQSQIQLTTLFQCTRQRQQQEMIKMRPLFSDLSVTWMLRWLVWLKKQPLMTSATLGRRV